MHMVHDKTLAAIDLNLLVVLRALLVECHVTRAAARVGLSQSATSHALSRLRELFGDPLLVRNGRTLSVTRRAAVAGARAQPERARGRGGR
jgi:DNA-binding transcriptional LysR family regulator